MKVDIKSKTSAFEAYQVTFTIETAEEATMFHDNVAIKICGGSNDFIGEAYKRCDGKKREDFHGEI